MCMLMGIFGVRPTRRLPSITATPIPRICWCRLPRATGLGPLPPVESCRRCFRTDKRTHWRLWMPLLSTGQAIAESLIAHGVNTVFGIPGAHMYDFNDALARHKDELRFITTRHEQGAGYMAFGYAKSTGRGGTYTAVPGRGVLNSGAALCTAYGAIAPVLCITGNIMARLIGQGRGQLHELPDQLALLRGLTKWSERINHPTEAPRVMAEAFRQLASGRIRPVAVEAPWDVFGMDG